MKTQPPSCSGHMCEPVSAPSGATSSPIGESGITDEMQITALLNEIGDIREAKVAALKAQIESDTYDVTGEQVAHAMLAAQ